MGHKKHQKIHVGEMIHPKGVSINSNLPGGWERASSYGERLVIKRQKPGRKGDQPPPAGPDKVTSMSVSTIYNVFS